MPLCLPNTLYPTSFALSFPHPPPLSSSPILRFSVSPIRLFPPTPHTLNHCFSTLYATPSTLCLPTLLPPPFAFAPLSSSPILRFFFPSSFPRCPVSFFLPTNSSRRVSLHLCISFQRRAVLYGVQPLINLKNSHRVGYLWSIFELTLLITIFGIFFALFLEKLQSPNFSKEEILCFGEPRLSQSS